jgi:acid stress-induced BolA-like protein IbaG/YrbA
MPSITEQITVLIKETIPDAIIVVDGGGGHFTIEVTSTEFEGKNRIQQQRLVYKAIWDLMKGNDAPVHAVDKLTCKIP